MSKLGTPTYTENHHVEFFRKAYLNRTWFFFKGKLCMCNGIAIIDDIKVYITSFGTITLNRK